MGMPTSHLRTRSTDRASRGSALWLSAPALALCAPAYFAATAPQPLPDEHPRSAVVVPAVARASSDAAAPPAPQAPTPPPPRCAADQDAGACVHDVLADALRRWNDPLGNGPIACGDLAAAPEPLPDLDGDGVPEQAVYSERTGCAGMGGNCIYLLYLSHHGCAAFGGAFYFELQSAKRLAETHGGVHDLRVFGQDGCAGMAGSVEHLRWNGKLYQPVRSIGCTCPDEDPTAHRSPECP